MTENEVSYRLTVDDVMALNEYFTRHRPDGKPRSRRHLRWLWICLVCLAVVQVICYLAPSPPQKGPERKAAANSSAIISGSLVILVMTAFLLAPTPLSRWLTRASLRKKLPAAIYRERSLRIEPQSFTVTSGTETTTAGWDTIQHVALINNYAFLINIADNAYVLPRHAFANEEDFQDFVADIKRYHAAQHEAT